MFCWEHVWGYWLQSMGVTPMYTLYEHQWCFILVKWIFLDVHVRMAFVLILLVHFNIWILFMFWEFIAYMWLEIWDNLYGPVARWLVYCGFHIFWHENLWECSTIKWSRSHLLDHTNIMLNFQVNVIILRAFFGGAGMGKIWHVMCIASFNC